MKDCLGHSPTGFLLHIGTGQPYSCLGTADWVSCKDTSELQEVLHLEGVLLSETCATSDTGKILLRDMLLRIARSRLFAKNHPAPLEAQSHLLPSNHQITTPLPSLLTLPSLWPPLCSKGCGRPAPLLTWGGAYFLILSRELAGAGHLRTGRIRSFENWHQKVHLNW